MANTHLLIPILDIENLQYSIGEDPNEYGQGQKYILEKIKFQAKSISLSEDDINKQAADKYPIARNQTVMKEDIVYVPISVESEELPKYGYISAVQYLRGRERIADAKYIGLHNYKPLWHGSYDNYPFEIRPHHWLKPVPLSELTAELQGENERLKEKIYLLELERTQHKEAQKHPF